MIFRRISILVFLLVSILCISSCKEDSEAALKPSSGKANMVTLDLTVSVDELLNPSIQSRTFDGDSTFEPATSPYELLHTLRVIICHPDGRIEHNRRVDVDGAQNSISSDELKFKVVAGELKTIYLIGNEDYLVSLLSTEESVGNYFDTFMVDDIFKKIEVENLLLSMPGNAPVIDNSDEALNKQYIPMSECFDVHVPYPIATEDFLQSANLFITRSLIKFSFNIKVDTEFPKGTFLDGIKIAGLGNCSYFLPRDTWYNPPKYTPSDNSYGGRFIDYFSVPSDVDDKYCVFRSLIPVDMSKVGETQLAPQSYLPETKDGKYVVSLLFTGNDELSELLGTQQLELTEIPRNTHVKVNITFRTHEISATVDLVPYIGVTLDPTFGID